MMLSSIPPTVLVLISVFSVQIGAGIAAQLFPVLGAEGTVALRVLFSALLLTAAARHRLLSLRTLFANNPALLLGFGLCIAAMNMFFYLSIDRIPLGAAVAIEFAGPLGLAAFKSKRLIHVFWVVVAAIGILFLTPITGVSLDTLGIVFALLAGLGWALFIVLAERVGSKAAGNDGLVIGMAISAIVLLPYAIPVIPTVMFNPLVLLAAFGVALLSTTIPFSFEFEALKKLPARNYGILVSIEPVAAAVIGALMLGERIGVQGLVAVACVVSAAIGISLSDRNSVKNSDSKGN